VAIFVIFTLIARSRYLCPVSISFVGYSKTPTSSIAVFQITNRSAAAFMCYVSPGKGDTARDRTRDLHLRAVPACGAVEMWVPLPADMNLWRFGLQVDELRAGRNWEFKLRRVLRRVDRIHIPNGRTYSLMTPSLPELKTAQDAEQSDPQEWFQPFAVESKIPTQDSRQP
jgi:hypothetical protein